MKKRLIVIILLVNSISYSIDDPSKQLARCNDALLACRQYSQDLVDQNNLLKQAVQQARDQRDEALSKIDTSYHLPRSVYAIIGFLAGSTTVLLLKK